MRVLAAGFSDRGEGHRKKRGGHFPATNTLIETRLGFLRGTYMLHKGMGALFHTAIQLNSAIAFYKVRITAVLLVRFLIHYESLSARKLDYIMIRPPPAPRLRM